LIARAFLIARRAMSQDLGGKKGFLLIDDAILVAG
jgi:hypothetical protein